MKSHLTKQLRENQKLGDKENIQMVDLVLYKSSALMNQLLQRQHKLIRNINFINEILKFKASAQSSIYRNPIIKRRENPMNKTYEEDDQQFQENRKRIRRNHQPETRKRIYEKTKTLIKTVRRLADQNF